MPLVKVYVLQFIYDLFRSNDFGQANEILDSRHAWNSNERISKPKNVYFSAFTEYTV